MRLVNNSLKEAGDFEIIKPLARSGFSHVYLAQSKITHKKYALKAVKNPNNKVRINQEIEVLKALKSSENLLRLYKVFKDNKKLFFVYELADGGDLKDWVDYESLLTEKEILNVLKNVLDTLKLANTLDIVHSDIKPDNILKHQEKYCLCDWGLSLKVKDKQKIIQQKSDNNFTAPEVYKGFACKASDIYSLGLTLYYLATGKYAYDLKSKDEYAYSMYAHCNLPLDISLVSSKLLQQLILAMTEKDIDKRISLDEIEAFLKGTYSIHFETISDINYLQYKNKSSEELYYTLAEQNIAFAQNNLAVLYENQKEFSKAYYWYEKASSNGFVKSYYNMALCYKHGRGTQANLKRAFDFFKQAAINNHDKSIYYLGYFYEKGEVVEKDLQKALKLYYEAAQLGNRKAYEKLITFQGI